MPTLTVTISEDVEHDLDALVSEYETTRERLVADAVERFVKEESEIAKAIREGDEDFAAGRFITHEDLMAELRATREAKRAA